MGRTGADERQDQGVHEFSALNLHTQSSARSASSAAVRVKS
jgi:hypothetical protein